MSNSPLTDPDSIAPRSVAVLPSRLVSWGAIWAGWGAATALQVLFLMLGAGVGFAIYTPLKDANPAADLSAGAAVIQGVCAVVALWIGGWVAGRFTATGTRTTGSMHGFLVWCVSTLAGVLALSGGTGWAINDLSKLAGGGLAMMGKAAPEAAGQAANLNRDALRRNGDELSSFTSEATAFKPKDDSPAAAIRAKREIGFAVTKLFDPAQNASQEENKQRLIRALQDNTSMTPAEATSTVDEWMKSYADLKAELQTAKDEAAEKARVAANESAKDLSVLCFVGFIAFAIGAIAATLGGKVGAQAAVRRMRLLDSSII